MVEEKFIWCRNCNEIHHVSPYDKVPTYVVAEGYVKETPTDDWRKFMHRHDGHKLERLEGASEKITPSGQAVDPMSVGYIEVTNGQESFLLRSSRRRIEEPVSFQLMRGRIGLTHTTLEIQENEIKKEMKNHFSWAPLPLLSSQKIDLFVKLFKEVAKGLDSKEIRIGETSFSDDSVAYGVLDSTITERLMEMCANQFPPAELDAIRRFIETHRESDDVMALVIRHHYKIEEPLMPAALGST
ncbi:MAG: hypothetical protein ACE5HC_06175 [Candidatus Binatia bacterium]